MTIVLSFWGMKTAGSTHNRKSGRSRLPQYEMSASGGNDIHPAALKIDSRTERPAPEAAGCRPRQPQAALLAPRASSLGAPLSLSLDFALLSTTFDIRGGTRVGTKTDRAGLQGDRATLKSPGVAAPPGCPRLPLPRDWPCSLLRLAWSNRPCALPEKLGTRCAPSVPASPLQPDSIWRAGTSTSYRTASILSCQLI